MILLVDNSPSHFIRTLAAFLRKYYFKHTSLDVEAVHFGLGLTSLCDWKSERKEGCQKIGQKLAA